jgi:hypothetical protein
MRREPLVILVVVAVGVGCAPPPIGQEPAGADVPAATASSSSGGDTGFTSQAQQSPTTNAAPLPVPDAGTDAAPPVSAVPCTEAGAVQSGGHCYFALSTPTSWDDALTACAAVHAHLVTITSTVEQTAAAGLIPTDERWIGLRRPSGSAIADASYTWITGEPRGTFQAWSTARNEPDGSCPTCTTAGTAECARLLTQTDDNAWADDACAALHPSICERE